MYKWKSSTEHVVFLWLMNSKAKPGAGNMQKLPAAGIFGTIVCLCAWDNGNNFMLISGNKMQHFGTREISWHQHLNFSKQKSWFVGYQSG